MSYKYLLLLLTITLSVDAKKNYHGKVEQGIIQNMVQGDVACYVDITDIYGIQHNEMASFDVCNQHRLINKNVKLHYQKSNVLAASCYGNPDCGRSDVVYLIDYVEEISPLTVHVPSHCFHNESVIFSCNTAANKVISICSSPTLGYESGYLQYRYGSIGSFPEYVYPSNHEKASKFFYSGNLTYAGGGGSYLKFVNGTYNYVIYAGIGRGWEQQGLVIKDRQHEISRMSCQGAWKSAIGPQLFGQARLTRDSAGFEIPVDRY